MWNKDEVRISLPTRPRIHHTRRRNLASCSIAAFLDDFHEEDLWWNWGFNTGTGTYTHRGGYLYLNMTDESSSQKASYAAMDDYGGGRNEQWLYTGVEVRLRCSDDNKEESDIGGGIRTWGYKQGLVPPPPGALRFASYSPESDPHFVGFWAESWADGKSTLRERLIGIDMTEWHTYTILWELGNATFLVDGEVVASTDRPPSTPMAFWIYSENKRVYGPVGNFGARPIDLEYNESIQIDHVRFFMTKERFRQYSTDMSQHSDEISQLFSEAGDQMDSAKEEDIDTAELQADYTKAEEAWDKYHYLRTKLYLREIITQAARAVACKEIASTDILTRAQDIVREAKEKGEGREAIFMEADLNRAEVAWENGDCVPALTYLGKIVAKGPEPALLSLLVLVVLPLLLRRR